MTSLLEIADALAKGTWKASGIMAHMIAGGDSQKGLMRKKAKLEQAKANLDLQLDIKKLEQEIEEKKKSLQSGTAK